jgi:hypothetical protein
MSNTKIDPSQLNERLLNLFNRLSIEKLDDLAGLSASDLRTQPGVGDATIRDARELLARHGLCLYGDPQPQQVQTERPSVPLKSGQHRLYMVQASDYAAWGNGHQFPMRVATRDTLADMVERCAVDIAEWVAKDRGTHSPPSSLQVRVNIMELEVAT